MIKKQSKPGEARFALFVRMQQLRCCFTYDGAARVSP